MNKNIVFIMDDGYHAEYQYALPLFQKYNAVACTAVTSDLIGKTKAGTGELYSNTNELLLMQSCGWEILSHGKTHKELSKLSMYESENELKLSKEALTNLGFKVNSLVYPCHSYTDEVKFFASRYYKCARGRHGLSDLSDKYALNGIMVDDHTLINNYKRYIDLNEGLLIFYCHLCISKIIPSTIEDRLDTLEQLLKHAITVTKPKTLTEAISEY